MAKLPSTNSIVDYLNATGQDSSFKARRNLYNKQGLNKRLGEFVGSANQNLQLLKTLRGGSNTSSPSRNPSFFQGSAPPNAFEAERNNPPSFFRGDAPPNAFEAERNRGRDSALNFLRSNPATSPFADALGTTANSTTLYNRVSDRIRGGGQARQGQMDTTNRDRERGTTISATDKGIRPGESLQDIINRLSDPSAGMSRLPEGATAQSLIDAAIGEAGGQQYTIKSGDTLSAIAKRFGTTVDELARTNNIANPDRITAGDVLNITGLKTPSTPTTPAASPTTDTTSPNVPDVANPETPIGQRDAAMQQQFGVSASTILGEYTPPSEAELVNEYLNSTEGQLLLEKQELQNQNAYAKAEAAKDALETKYAQEKESLENRLASSGLAFSGIRGTQVKALADSLAASTLEVDREFASKLLEADIRFRETVLDGVADLLGEAQKGRDDAIEQLNKAGYAVVGDQIVPTLSRENARKDDIRADANLAISQRRLELAEAANARAASKAAQGSTDSQDWALLLAAINEGDDGTITDEEIRLWANQNTDLSSSEIEVFIDTRPDRQWVQDESVALVADFYDQPFWSRLKRGDQQAEALAKAKKEAIQDLPNVDVKSEEERQLLEQYINSVTLDQVKGY